MCIVGRVCRMGSANGRGDEGMGSNWSSCGHCSMEFSSHAPLLEGMGYDSEGLLLTYQLIMGNML